MTKRKKNSYFILTKVFSTERKQNIRNVLTFVLSRRITIYFHFLPGIECKIHVKSTQKEGRGKKKNRMRALGTLSTH